MRLCRSWHLPQMGAESRNAFHLALHQPKHPGLCVPPAMVQRAGRTRGSSCLCLWLGRSWHLLLRAGVNEAPAGTEEKMPGPHSVLRLDPGSRPLCERRRSGASVSPAYLWLGHTAAGANVSNMCNGPPRAGRKKIDFFFLTPHPPDDCAFMVMVAIMAVIIIIVGIIFSYSDELKASNANSGESRTVGSDP